MFWTLTLIHVPTFPKRKKPPSRTHIPYFPSTQLHVRHDKNFWIHHRNSPPPPNDTRVPRTVNTGGGEGRPPGPQGAEAHPPPPTPGLGLVTGVLVPADATGITKIQQMAYRTATSSRRERVRIKLNLCGSHERMMKVPKWTLVLVKLGLLVGCVVFAVFSC